MSRNRASAKAAGSTFERLIADCLAEHVDDRTAKILDRLVLTPAECWEWTGARLASGYGSVRIDGRSQVVHRVTYELVNGPIPAGLQIDHLCRNRACANPAHLEAVTQAENLRRGRGWGGINASKESCPAGHPYSEANTYSRPSAPTTRECRICRRANRARLYSKESAA